MTIQTNKISKRSKQVAFIALILWTISYSVKMYFGQEVVYDIGQAFTIFLLILAIHLSTAGCFRIFSFIFMGVATSNIIDESFFDSSVLQINDFIAVAVFVIIGFWRYARKKRYI